MGAEQCRPCRLRDDNDNSNDNNDNDNDNDKDNNNDNGNNNDGGVYLDYWRKEGEERGYGRQRRGRQSACD